MIKLLAKNSTIAACAAAIALGASPARAQGLAKFEPAGNGVYHGVSVQETWTDAGLREQTQEYQKLAGKRLAVITWFASLYEKGNMTAWRHNYIATLERVKRMKAVSLVKFSVQDYAYDRTGKMAGVKQISQGVYDAYFEEFADTIKSFKDPVFISVNHEMNGTWYPYSQAYPGSTATAADFVAMWQRIVDIFRKRGANNAAFVWSPNVPDVGPVPYSKYYPGDAYVDWVGVSFYSGNPISNLDPIYRTYAARKPIFITEWATSPEQNKHYPGFPGEAKWVAEVFKALDERYPRVKAISWFQHDKSDGNHLLQRVPEQRQVYQEDVQSPRYIDTAGNLLSLPPGGLDIPRTEIPAREIILREPTAPQRTPVVNDAPKAVPRERIKLQIMPTERVPVQR
jgi:hypothetical protein